MSAKAKPRILFVGPLPPEAGGLAGHGGIATHCWELAREAARHGYAVSILTDSADSFSQDGIVVCGYPRPRRVAMALHALRHRHEFPVKIPTGSPVASSKEKLKISYHLSRLNDAIKAVKPDILHVHSLHNPFGLAAALAEIDIPIVVTNHEFYPQGQTDLEIEKAHIILNRTARLICISNHTRQRMTQFGLGYQDPIRVIPIPVHSRRYPLKDRPRAKQRLGLSTNPTILFIGSANAIAKKGLDILLMAAAEDRSLAATCQLVIRCNSHDATRARLLARKGHLNIKLVERIPEEMMPDTLGAADVFAMPSRSEGFGIVYLNALLSGTPVVGFTGTLAQIESQLGIEVGEKYDPHTEDKHELAAKIRRVLDTDFPRFEVRRRVVAVYDWERRFVEFADVYQGLKP